jgi:hypothetical protein
MVCDGGVVYDFPFIGRAFNSSGIPFLYLDYTFTMLHRRWKYDLVLYFPYQYCAQVKYSKLP